MNSDSVARHPNSPESCLIRRWPQDCGVLFTGVGRGGKAFAFLFRNLSSFSRRPHSGQERPPLRRRGHTLHSNIKPPGFFRMHKTSSAIPSCLRNLNPKLPDGLVSASDSDRWWGRVAASRNKRTEFILCNVRRSEAQMNDS